MDALTSLASLTPGIDAYTDDGHRRKRLMHSAGRAFLQRLARDLGLTPSERDVRSNVAGIAVSGEVTLHADRIYVQISEHCFGGRSGASVLYRTCGSRRDYCGGTNHHKSLREVQAGYPAFVAECRALMRAPFVSFQR